MNYAELEQAIKDWLNKPGLGSVIPTIIRFGQRDLEDTLRIRSMEYHPATSALAAGSSTLALPSDYVELIYLQLLNGTEKYPVEYRVDVKEMNSLAYNTDTTGIPAAVTRVADNLVFDVLTDDDYTRDWAYYRRLPTLIADQTNGYNTNWWSENAEEAFLMACLSKASIYIRGVTREDKEKWERAAIDAKEILRKRSSGESTSGVILRSSPWTL